MKYTTFTEGAAAEAPVAYALKQLGASRIWQSVIIIGALTGNALLAAGLPVRPDAHLVRHVARRPAARASSPSCTRSSRRRTGPPGSPDSRSAFPPGLVDIGDAADLSNIGTLFAFVLVSLGVIFLRRTQPDRPRGFRVPLVPLFPLISVVLCGGLMTGLTVITWIRFFVWLAIGLLHLFPVEPPAQRVRAHNR